MSTKTLRQQIKITVFIIIVNKCNKTVQNIKEKKIYADILSVGKIMIR